MLDVVNRADKAAFDAQVLHSGIPLDLEKAGNLLSAGSIGLLKDANILDIGCGLGDLTYGLTHSPASLTPLSMLSITPWKACVKLRSHRSPPTAIPLIFLLRTH